MKFVFLSPHRQNTTWAILWCIHPN